MIKCLCITSAVLSWWNCVLCSLSASLDQRRIANYTCSVHVQPNTLYLHMGSSEFEKLKEYPRAGWTGSDCSIDESLLPDNLGFPHGDACDSSLYACASVTVNTENIFQSDNFACKVAVSSRWCFTSICVGFVRVAVMYATCTFFCRLNVIICLCVV